MTIIKTHDTDAVQYKQQIPSNRDNCNDSWLTADAFPLCQLKQVLQQHIPNHHSMRKTKYLKVSHTSVM